MNNLIGVSGIQVATFSHTPFTDFFMDKLNDFLTEHDKNIIDIQLSATESRNDVIIMVVYKETERK